MEVGRGAHGRDRGGRFRTRGRNGSATVRGTRWLTEDRCDGTLFKVAEGAIDVRDDGARKTVHLKRGKRTWRPLRPPRSAGADLDAWTIGSGGRMSHCGLARRRR